MFVSEYLNEEDFFLFLINSVHMDNMHAQESCKMLIEKSLLHLLQMCTFLVVQRGWRANNDTWYTALSNVTEH